MRILVIEDNVKHLSDAKDFFGSIDDLEVVFIDDFTAIEDTMRGSLPTFFDGFDGVISDIFFPRCKNSREWGQEEPIGVAVMILCKELGKPCILNTAGYHHGSKYQWICTLQRSLRLPEMVDASGDYFKEADAKNWARALEALRKLIGS